MRSWDLAQRTITLKFLLDKTTRSQEEKEEEQQEIEGKEDKVNPSDKIIKTREQIIAAAFSEKYLYGSYEDGSINQWNFINQG
jgi:hypothetical protein